ncbi:hypothetical protein N665_0301s0018 [Sinapis alba]|nr:hypothetical protein N665_0301s0018 [Sinapis alba]
MHAMMATIVSKTMVSHCHAFVLPIFLMFVSSKSSTLIRHVSEANLGLFIKGLLYTCV